jgi:uncharacterized HAD superfamily protein
MSNRRLCIDIDNVIAQTDAVMRRVIQQFTGGRVNLAYEDIVEFDYHKCKDKNGCAITKEEWLEVHDLFSEPSFLSTVQPVPGVHDALAKLRGEFVIHLATSRLHKARVATVQWLDAHRFPVHDLHFLKHGEKHLSLGKFSAVVEDHYEQALGFAKTGTPAFLMTHPWNKTKPREDNLQWIKGWEEFIAARIPLQES